MFEDQDKKSTPPAAPVEDMFGDLPDNLPMGGGEQKPKAEVPASASEPVAKAPETASEPSVPQTAKQIPDPAPAMPAQGEVPVSPDVSKAKSGSFLKKGFIVLVALAVVSAAIYLAYILIIQTPEEVQEFSPEILEETAVDDSVVDDFVVPGEELEPVVVDSDGDGLNDDEEAEYGTDPEKADSDSDGLGDKEEVSIYDTDPLDSDSDDDTFLDGAEVKNGYNPNGEGRLFTVPEIK